MAFGVKYSKKFQRAGITKTYRVDILSETGGAVVVPDKMGADPLQVRTLSSEREEEKIVIGSECTFEFVLRKRVNEAAYDELFESEYRDHIVKFYDDDTSTLLWQGYLQPENMYKSVFDSNLHIYLSATDALKDLSDFEFLDSGSIVTGRLSPLEILKICLANLDTDSQFQYNFVVKLGTKHTGMGANDTALKTVTHDTRRFVRVKDGRTEVDSCLTVIEKVLTPYNCTLRQYGGRYYILQQYEQSSYYYHYNWALAFTSKASSNDNVTLTSVKFRRDAEQSLLPSVRQIGIRLLNRNTGGNLVPDINNYNPIIGEWDYDNYTSDFGTSGGQIRLRAEQAAAPHPVSNGYITLKSDINIERVTTGDYLKLRFSHQAVDGLEVTNEWPEFRINTIKAGNKTIGSWQRMPNGWTLYESILSSQFQLVGDIGTSNDYNIEIEIGTNNDSSDYECYFKDFEISRETIVDGEAVTDLAYDVFYLATSNKGKKRAEIKDVYFGDTNTLTDWAATVYSSALTYEWARYDKTEALTLLQTWAKDYLLNRQQYTKYIIIDVKDSNDTLSLINWVTFAGDNYQITSFEKSYRTSWVRLHLRQILSDDITLNWGIVDLTSIDGESSAGATPYDPGIDNITWDMVTGKPAVAVITGTPSNQQVAVWASSTTIGAVNITWDGSKMVVDGDIESTGDIIAYA